MVSKKWDDLTDYAKLFEIGAHGDEEVAKRLFEEPRLEYSYSPEVLGFLKMIKLNNISSKYNNFMNNSNFRFKKYYDFKSGGKLIKRTTTANYLNYVN